MVYSYQIDGIPIQTGDIIGTTDIELEIQAGEFWRLLGRLMPGPVDHIAIYIGPGGRCIESGGRGVIAFEIDEGGWLSGKMSKHRGRFLDQFYGVAYPLAGRGLSDDEEIYIRESVAAYCLEQAQGRKRYNLNFLDSETDESFYCSQLAYKAYIRHGINLNTGVGVPNLPGTSSVVFPQEIWNACLDTKIAQK
ncbi:MAG: hypothetical protein HN413_04915 [Chloroflexi bacterium]|jgi:hypothetical protein|nr:hypothetical protein [Chloroflexota bacterium]